MNCNPANYEYIDTLRTVALDNGFVFNLIQWQDAISKKPFYEIRLGYLNDLKTTPVVTLYKNTNPVATKNYWDTLMDNASDIYLFNKEGDE